MSSTNKIDEILITCGLICDTEVWDGKSKEAKQQLIELFMSCVPENPYCHDSDKFDFFNDCRDQMVKNLEKLK